MALTNQFDLDCAATRLPTKKISGGQRKIPGALTIDAPRAFSPAKLTSHLERQPMYVHNWQVCKDFVFEEDGVETTEFIAGRIKSSKLLNGIYKWHVKFDDGDNNFYACDDIVEIIVASRRLGLDVTSSEETEETS